MDILYLLLPLSVLLVLGLIGLFAWALHRGQFDDLEREGLRLMEIPEGPVRPDASVSSATAASPVPPGAGAGSPAVPASRPGSGAGAPPG